MKKLLLSLFLFGLFFPLSWAQATWKSPDYKPETYRKVMVLAKVTDFMARRQLEEFTVDFLNKKGMVAIPAYSHINRSEGMTREEFLVLADSLQVDALITYSVNGAVQRAENSPTLSVGVGVGMYGGYAGASVPIAGGVKLVTEVKMSVYFYNRASLDEQWAYQLSGTLEGGKGTEKLAYTFAKSTVKSLFKDGMFLLKK